MNDTPPLTPRYVADVSPVREVTLAASVDLAFWQARLEEHNLCCAEREGRAQIMITGAAARFKGVAFRELSIAVGVCRERGGERLDGFFLVQAFNSVRFFAWVERTLFSTPYYFANVNVDLEPRPCVGVKIKEQAILATSLGSLLECGRLAPERQDFATWEGPLFLPPRTPGGERRVFFARLEGETQYFPFLAARDEFRIEPHSAAPVLAWLQESHCTPREWVVRRSGRHAKSKTVRRIRSLGFNG